MQGQREIKLERGDWRRTAILVKPEKHRDTAIFTDEKSREI